MVIAQVRINDGLAMALKARPGMHLREGMQRGLQDLQQQMDAKLLQRLRKKARDSVVCSSAF
jgi:hypothetical protein